MRKVISLALLLCSIFTTLWAQSHAYKVEEIPMVHLQNRTRYVSNPDGILSAGAVAAMDTTLFALEQRTGIQTLVVAVKQIDGGDCFEFAYQLGEKNGVGEKGKDNGLVVLLVTEERCIQFATGYGLEGVLPDAVCKQIQVRYMNKYLGEGNWDAGMLAGIQAISRQLDGTGELPVPRKEEETDYLLLIILICCFIIVPTLLWFSVRQRKRCPQCHKHTLRQLSIRTISRMNGIRTEEIVLHCTNCGHIVRRQRQVRDEDDFHHRGGNGGPFLGGPFFGGGFGGSGGGGFSGGSFGGGSFGGGGAGSKF